MHVPALKEEVLRYLDPQPGDRIIDGTVDGGGHAEAILDRIKSDGKLLGIDLTPELITQLRRKKRRKKWNNLKLRQGNYRELAPIARQEDFYPVDGVLLDLGFSLYHVKKITRGFSFEKDEPLDMRYDPQQSVTAKDILNQSTVEELEKLFTEYGQERYAPSIAQEIVQYREEESLQTTGQLVNIIQEATPSSYQNKKIHCATRVFQALRIAVNDELENLKRVLPQAAAILCKGGRLVVISFHSLEDAIVKDFFRGQEELGIMDLLTQKPCTPGAEEIKNNRRARSAKLRAAQKTINF